MNSIGRYLASFDSRLLNFRVKMDSDESYESDEWVYKSDEWVSDTDLDHTNIKVNRAARYGKNVLVKELLYQGYPTNGQDNRGWRPLHEAAAGGHVECVRLLLAADDVEVDALTHRGLTSLYLACRPDPCHVEVIKLLLCAGADPNMKCGDNWHLPLPTAVLNNTYDIVKLLLDAGGDPNRADRRTGAPLMAAAMEGNLRIAQLLVERGAKVDVHDDRGRNAIHLLLLPTYHVKDESSLVQFVNLLVNGGLDVNARMFDGTTPLMLAAQRNLSGVVLRLLELGADPNTKKYFRVLALHYAIEFCLDSSMEEHDGSNWEGETTDCVLRRLLDVTSRDVVIPAKIGEIRNSVFHLAVEKDKFNAIKLMINALLPPDAFLRETSSWMWLDEANVQWMDDTDFGLHCKIHLGFSQPTNQGMEVYCYAHS